MRDADADRCCEQNGIIEPVPCLWNDCSLLLWHVGGHLPSKSNDGVIARMEGGERAAPNGGGVSTQLRQRGEP